MTERAPTPGWTRHLRHYLRKLPQDSRFIAQMAADCLRRPERVAALDAAALNASSLTWLTHACFLLKLGGRLVITDPVLSTRVGPRWGGVKWGPKRYLDAPIAASALPEVDLVLISHAHFDHLDLETLAGLRSRQVVCPLGVDDLLRPLANLGTVHALGHDRTAFELHSTSDDDAFRVRAFSVRHPGARWRHDVQRQCNGYLIEAGAHRLHFIGDTAHSPHFQRLPDAVRGSELALLPIGGYDPFERNHCTPEHALDIARALGAPCVVPSQYATFRLSREPLDEPLRRLRARAATHATRVRAPAPGVPVPLTDLIASPSSVEP